MFDPAHRFDLSSHICLPLYFAIEKTKLRVRQGKVTEHAPEYVCMGPSESTARHALPPITMNESEKEAKALSNCCIPETISILILS